MKQFFHKQKFFDVHICTKVNNFLKTGRDFSLFLQHIQRPILRFAAITPHVKTEKNAVADGRTTHGRSIVAGTPVQEFSKADKQRSSATCFFAEVSKM